MSKLIGGDIPVGEHCPWKDKCELVSSCLRCVHPEAINTRFSCACARGFDIVESKGKPKDEKVAVAARKIMDDSKDRSWK